MSYALHSEFKDEFIKRRSEFTHINITIGCIYAAFPKVKEWFKHSDGVFSLSFPSNVNVCILSCAFNSYNILFQHELYNDFKSQCKKA
jgi:hypothetical protein